MGEHQFIGNKYSVKYKQLESIGHYSSIDPIVLDGDFANYENGVIADEGNYVHNKKTGTWTFYRTGTKDTWYTESYVSTDKIRLRSYYPDGRTKRKEKHNETYTVATGKCYNERGKKIPFTPFYTAPKPLYRIDEYLAENLVYPEKAANDNIEGTVILKFIVNEDGEITNVEVVKGIAGGCNDEASWVITNMPKWSPGIKDDKKVKVPYYMPVQFRLTN